MHDRHALSYPLVESYAKKHSGTTLVLFDYHHDVGALGSDPLSSNWVGKLLEDGTISRVFWISGRDLLLPNQNARIAWLRRKLRAFPPGEAERIESKITLVDWHSFEKMKITGPLAVSVDFDIFCHDPGTPPERFADEIAAWIAGEKPAMVTLALSSAYQQDAVKAWGYLTRFIGAYGKESQNSVWYLEAGIAGPVEEGVEERNSWRRWDAERDSFGRRNTSFLQGSAIWIAPPLALRDLLLGFSMRPGDASSKDILSGWRDEKAAALERDYPQDSTDAILSAAAASLEEFWTGKKNTLPASAQDKFGLAVRILEDGGDRGCFSIYRGLSEPLASAAYCVQLAASDPRYSEVIYAERPLIDLELSVFGTWEGMKDPYDFRPGLDSLLLVDGNRTTLLQASIAAERGYARDEFLSRLSNKAGLGMDGWKAPGVRFARAVSIWSRRPLLSIESSASYQKYEKK